MGKMTIYDVTTGEYKTVEVEDEPINDEFINDQPPTIEEQINELNYTISLLPDDIRLAMLEEDLKRQLGGL